ncbi:hypothetical protein KUTeg_014420 [Tegillarca granosa]|uniref:DUF4764 domain-containing protein n=1 Tax=Tegillarca granosa TaxID=220873 RepID=A0ABQ9EWH5_TEGGR|nr:hypothetical protein KUTeg_014420 [Tegillarca granosa]
MADTESVNGIITGSHVLGQDTLIITDGNVQGIEDEVSEEDILQQALEEASESLAQDTEGYTADDDTVAEQLVQSVAGGEFETPTETEDATFDGTTYAIVSGDNLTATTDSTVFISENTDSNTNADVLQTAAPVPQASQGVSVRIVSSNEASGAPLGSSQNPIRIIQQGNQYTPVQQLTTEQLQQIMQVVQQQQVAKDTSTSGQSILYNPQTNTKIVYRVIYPSELHKSGTFTIKQSQRQQTVVLGQGPKRPYNKKKIKEEEDKYEGPELSKEEKEERKKHRPRTRSGRISKPPKHMVKDYKHIHVLDFDEEKGDASDGGYSDYKYSEDEGRDKEDDDNVYVHPGLGVNKPKNWKCASCHRSYIGRGGLGRHYRLYPDHGSISDHPEDGSTGSTSTDIQNGFVITPGNMSEDSNTQDSTSSTPPKSNVGRPPLSRRGRFFGRHRHHDNPLKRKNKLRELIKECEDEELMEIVLPRLANVITLWEFLLMKAEKAAGPNCVNEIYHEFETLSKEVKKLCKKHLIPVTTEVDNNNSNAAGNRLKVQNSSLADVLGLNIGTYEIKNIPEVEPTTFHYKLLTTDPTVVHTAPGGHTTKRTLEYVTHDQLVTQSPSKKQRTLMPVSSSNSAQPMVVTMAKNGSGQISLLNHNTDSANKQIHPKTSANVMRIIQPSPQQPVTVSHNSTPNYVQLVVKGTDSHPPSFKSSIQTAASSSLSTDNTQNIPIITNSASLVNNSDSHTTPVTGQVVKVNMVPVTIQSVKQSHLSATTSLNGESSSHVTQTSTKGVQNETGIVENLTGVNVISSITNNQIITSDSAQTKQEPRIITVNPMSSQTSNGTGSISNTVTNKPGIGTVSLLADTSQHMLLNNRQDVAATTSLLNSVMVDGANPSISQSTDNQIDTNTNSMEVIKIEEQQQPQVTEMIQLATESQVSNDRIEGIQMSADQVMTNIFQTADGIIIIQNPDGSTVQLQGGDGEPIPLETVQALLAIDDGQLLQTATGEPEGVSRITLDRVFDS